MDEKWFKAKEIFEAALNRSVEERPKFLFEACGQDNSLLSEVESLLESISHADNFLETPFAPELAEVIQSQTRLLECGTNLSHYEIIEQIGEGGMSEVYLAKDMNLNRKVALKLLTPSVTIDNNKINRFRQEALVISSLNHPNIVTIYEIGWWQEKDFIVTEFIEGMTLRSWLRDKKPSIDKSLDIALQIASAR